MNNIDEKELSRLIKCSGKLINSDIEKFKNVYKKTMNDLIEIFSKDQEMKKYIGME